ncbi:MAG: ATP-binding protein [Myxococcales bacterium]|nr:ATP-binding protein [Myxococcales bacterium]
MSKPGFLAELGQLINAGQSRSIVLAGNVHDLFHLPAADGPGRWVRLIDLLLARWTPSADHLLVVYEINGPIRFGRDTDRQRCRDAYVQLRTGMTPDDSAVRALVGGAEAARTQQLADAAARQFDAHLQDAVAQPTKAFELLRQLCLAARTLDRARRRLLPGLLVLVEDADLLLPAGDFVQLTEADRHRIGICRDWFADPDFQHGEDTVLLIAESLGGLHSRVTRMPQVLTVDVPAPDTDTRRRYIEGFVPPAGAPRPELPAADALARATAGLSIHALRQLLLGAAHAGRPLQTADVVGKVEAFIQSQLGEGVVEFKQPTHTLDDVVGYTRLKAFLREEFVPRVRSGGGDALSGAAVAGPIGAGKTFIFEAVASELGMVVLVLKNIRSQWFGQTDVVFEQLRRVLYALDKVLVFVDEADTMFGGVGGDVHETERRLTGRIQQMMSDPALRGRVVWLLLTARIERLSPDLRRPGRAGDLILPVLDPDGADRMAFVRWLCEGVLAAPPAEAELAGLLAATQAWSAAGYASMRSGLRSRARRDGPLTPDAVLALVADQVPAAIGPTRRWQELQARVNCTRKSLLPDVTGGFDEARAGWEAELRELERAGVGR